MATPNTPASASAAFDPALIGEPAKRLSQQLPLPLILGKMRVDVPEEDVISDPAHYPRPRDDVRTSLAQEIHDMGEYRLPALSRAAMMIELMARKMIKEDGLFHPCWDIRMNFSWNMSGRVEDGRETVRDFDARWAELIDTDPSVFHEACTRALAPYVDEFVDILEMDGALECSLDLSEPGRDTLILKSFKGESTGFRSRSDWSAHLRTLDDDALCDLWMSLRILDQDLSRKNRAEVMAGVLNDIRHEREVDWSDDVEALPF